MVKNYAKHTFEPKYLLDYRVQQILNNSTLLVVMLDGKESKPITNYVKPCSTLKLTENAWDSFLFYIKTNHQKS